jgi:hypothetical protein
MDSLAQDKVWPSRGRISILGIPNELLLLIFHNLEIVDQACLALSCWTLYHKIGPRVLGHPNLSLLCICFPAYSHHRFSPHQCSSPRPELLRRLEKDHYRNWLYCSACYILHPPSVFIDGINSSYHGRRCTWSNVVELCPCIQLTFQQKVRLTKYLKALSQNTDLENSPIIHGCLRVFKVDVGNIEGGPENIRYLSHECSILDHPAGIIKIKMNAYLDNKDHFIVQTKYDVLDFWAIFSV